MEKQAAITVIDNSNTSIYDNSVNWLKESTITRPATGFAFTEGAAWHPDGFFLFSDTPSNKIYQLATNGDCTVYLDKSGLAGDATGDLSDQLGSNGIAIDQQHNIIICQHGNHAIAKLDSNKQRSILADKYNGAPFNSPNDCIVHSDGTIYFTDPPYGLKKQVLLPNKFQPLACIYQLTSAGISLVGDELQYPNGLLLSADEKYLLVGSNHRDDPGILRYQLTAGKAPRYDGVFMAQHADGMTSGQDSNLYLATDEGVLIVSPSAKKLALIPLPESPSNLCWGGKGQQTLLVTARTSVYFITRPV